MSRKPLGPPDSLARAFATEIRAEMGRQRISARVLAPLIGKSPPYVQERLNEDRIFDLNDVARISEALKLDVDELMTRVLARTLDGIATIEHNSEIVDTALDQSA